jgi:hypothetical protein
VVICIEKLKEKKKRRHDSLLLVDAYFNFGCGFSYFNAANPGLLLTTE